MKGVMVNRQQLSLIDTEIIKQRKGDMTVRVDIFIVNLSTTFNSDDTSYSAVSKCPSC